MLFKSFKKFLSNLIFRPHGVQQTWSLYRKVAHPESITQFQLINLCNTLYKLLSHIIVQRLKPYIAEVVNPCQAEFAPGCRTSDNIILIQKVI